mmetsp:Transcript_20869/g.59517  ORF Transcript_20869/g.59517 Transcript_20869/m.59517 type:complete len:276 (+) Transcript_20869:377-1204(+)
MPTEKPSLSSHIAINQHRRRPPSPPFPTPTIRRTCHPSSLAEGLHECGGGDGRVGELTGRHGGELGRRDARELLHGGARRHTLHQRLVLHVELSDEFLALVDAPRGSRLCYLRCHQRLLHRSLVFASVDDCGEVSLQLLPTTLTVTQRLTLGSRGSLWVDAFVVQRLVGVVDVVGHEALQHVAHRLERLQRLPVIPYHNLTVVRLMPPQPLSLLGLVDLEFLEELQRLREALESWIKALAGGAIVRQGSERGLFVLAVLSGCPSAIDRRCHGVCG